MIDETTKFNRAEGFYKRDAQLGNVDGAYKNFVASAKVQRSEMDNFNTPDLDQGADSILRPGETLEDFDVTFRRPNAKGGRQGFDDGLSAKQKKALTITYPKSNNDLEIKKSGPVNNSETWKTSKKNLLNRYVESLPEGYLEDYKKLFLNDRGDGTFSKKASVEEGVATMEKKYGDILKTQYSSRQTNKSGKKFLDARVIDINSSILQDLKSKGSIVSGLADAKQMRVDDLKIVGDVKANTPPGKNIHHFMPLAGIEGESINLSSTKNTAVIDRKLNYNMSPFDKKLKANQKEQIKLLKEKPPGYEKRMEELNYKAKNILKNAGKELPASKGYLGYTQINVKPDGTYTTKIIGMDKNKSLAGLDGEEFIYKNISKENKIKVKSLIETIKEANPELAKKISIQLNSGLPVDQMLAEIKKIPGITKLGKGFMKAGGPFEVAFFGLDTFNEFSKGKTGKQSLKTALSNVTFGAYEGGKREDLNVLLNTAKDLNLDTEGFSELKEMLDLKSKIAKQKRSLIDNLYFEEDSFFRNLEGGQGTSNLKAQQESLKILEKEFETKGAELQDRLDIDNLVNNYTMAVDTVAGNEFEKSKERGLLNQVKPEMGDLGSGITSTFTDYRSLLPQNFLQNSLTKAIPNTLRKLPFGAGSYFDPTSERAKLFDMNKEDKEKRIETFKPAILEQSKNTYYPKAQGGIMSLNGKK